MLEVRRSAHADPSLVPAEIAATDELAALRGHRAQLLSERERLQRVIDTVDRTIASLSGTSSPDDDDFFTGLAEGKNRLRKDLTTRFGGGADAQFAAAERATAGWGRGDYERAAEEGRSLLAAMSEARARGVAPDDEEAFDLVARHHAHVTAMWPADATAYSALGDILLDHPDQRSMIASVDADLPLWLSAAIKTYAADRLGPDPT